MDMAKSAGTGAVMKKKKHLKKYITLYLIFLNGNSKYIANFIIINTIIELKTVGIFFKISNDS